MTNKILYIYMISVAKSGVKLIPRSHCKSTNASELMHGHCSPPDAQESSLLSPTPMQGSSQFIGMNKKQNSDLQLDVDIVFLQVSWKQWTSIF